MELGPKSRAVTIRYPSRSATGAGVLKEDEEDYGAAPPGSLSKTGRSPVRAPEAAGSPPGRKATMNAQSGADFLPARNADHGRLMREAEEFQTGLLDQVRARLHALHYSKRTEQAYVGWIRRFVIANGRRHPRHLGGDEVEAYLTRLASKAQVSASTQNQALAALLFLYRDILKQDLPWMDKIVRAKRSRRIPVVLSMDELQRLLMMMDGQPWLMAALMYGTGMRLMECVRLRIKDVDFDRKGNPGARWQGCEGSSRALAAEAA